MSKPRIAIVVTARPSYSRLRSLILALLARPEIETQVIVGCSALLERYGRVIDRMRDDQIPIAAEVWATVEGENLLTSALGTGMALNGFADVFQRLKPDISVIHADRRELVGVAAAARLLEIPICHTQGGENSGSVDDDVRDAITQLAQYHLVSTATAKHRVYGLTGDWSRIHTTGCPSLDLCVGLEHEPPVTVQELGGAGALIDLEQPFVVVLQHPTTDRWEQAHDDMQATLSACEGYQTICFWPGEEAGAAGTSKALRAVQDRVHTVRNLPPARFLRLLGQGACLVGNSSSGLREASFLGAPVVNIGSRQHGRERASNVFDVPQFDAGLIREAIAYQVAHGRYPRSLLYGDGHSGERMADVLCECVGARAGAGRVEINSTQEYPPVRR